MQEEMNGGGGYDIGEPKLESAPVVIKRGRLDRRSYKYVRLPNGLKCILVKDPKTSSCLCSLSVRAGTALDPKEVPGLM